MREPFTIEHTPGGRTFLRGAGTLVLLIVIAVIVAFSSTSCVRTGHVGVVSDVRPRDRADARPKASTSSTRRRT